MATMDAPTFPSPAPSGGRDVWERWLGAWNAVFAGSLVLTTLAAVTSGDVTGSGLIVTAGLLALLAAGYVALFVVRRPWTTPGSVAIVYLVLAGLVFAALLRQSTAYFWLQPIMFSQVFWLLDTRRAIPLVAYYVAIVVQFSIELDGRPLGEQLPDLIGPVISIVFFVILSAFIGAIIRQSEDRRELIERLDATRRELAERERGQAVLEERERMSRELHDTLAQDLVGIVTHLQAADAASEAGEAARHRQEAARMAHEGLAETRRLVWALRPAELEGASLAESLERAIDRWRSTSGIRASLTVAGEVRALHPDVEVTLLRTAQESLANAARHAGAQEVVVSLSYLGDVVTLDVHDDGVGFDPGARADGAAGVGAAVGAAPGVGAGVGAGAWGNAETAAGDDGGPGGLGLGLRGMRERVERLGGSVAIESAPGEGTTIGVSLPTVVGST
jgi:signal transduction histidine kinase